jgi:OPA family sugar phosphate sensor protein UhpC-like MFS transporter
MAAADLSHKKAAATATGFTGLMAYTGAAVAGYPLGLLTDTYGWSGYFSILALCGAISTLLLLPLWSIKSRKDGLFKKQKGEEEQLA